MVLIMRRGEQSQEEHAARAGELDVRILRGASNQFYLQGGMGDTELLIKRSRQGFSHLVDIVCRTGKDDMSGKNRLF